MFFVGDFVGGFVVFLVVVEGGFFVFGLLDVLVGGVFGVGGGNYIVED